MVLSYVFCSCLRYRIYDLPNTLYTKPVWKILNPQIEETVQFTALNASQEFLNYLQTNALIVDLWGLQGTMFTSSFAWCIPQSDIMSVYLGLQRREMEGGDQGLDSCGQELSSLGPLAFSPQVIIWFKSPHTTGGLDNWDISFLDGVSSTLQKAVPNWAALSQASWSQVKATSWWTPRKYPLWWIRARCVYLSDIKNRCHRWLKISPMTVAWGSSVFLPIKKPFSWFIPVNPEGLKPWSPHPSTPRSFHMVGTTGTLQAYANNPAKG